ncbi:cell division protein FtsQ/DivIB [Haloferula sargassicola]
MSPRIFWFDFRRALVSGLRWILLASLALAGVGALWLGFERGLLKNDEFRLRELTMNDNAALSEARLLQVTGIDLDGSVFDCNPREIREKLMSLPEVQSARVSRSFPGSLAIEITARQPVLWVACQEEGRLARDPASGLLVDRDGLLFPCTAAMWEEAEGLPVIELEKEPFPLEAGMKVEHESFLRGMRLLAEARSASPEADEWIDTIRQYKGWGSQLVTRGGTVATFGHRDLKRQMNDFLTACEHAAGTGRKIATIELVGRRNIPVTFQIEGQAPPAPEPPREIAPTRPVSDLQKLLER